MASDDILSIEHCEAELADTESAIKLQEALLGRAIKAGAFTAAQRLSSQLSTLKSRRNHLVAVLDALKTTAGNKAITDDQKRARVLMEELPRIARYAPGFAEEMRRTLDRLLGVRLELVHDADREEVS